MSQSMFSAAGAIRAQQDRVDTIANNLANINTYGFKNVRTDFEDMLYDDMKLVQPAATGTVIQGNGAMVGFQNRSFKQGSLVETGNPLDVAINGSGFFAVMTPQGTIKYTRNGNFFASCENTGETDERGNLVETLFLVDSEGSYVLDSNGARIKLEKAPKQVIIAADGTIMYATESGENGDTVAAAAEAGKEQTETDTGLIEEPIVQKLAVLDFKNPKGLIAVGGTYFEPSENSGDAEAADVYTVEQNMLEGSNVDMAQEMTRLMRAQRALSFAARALTTADEMDAQTAQLRT